MSRGSSDLEDSATIGSFFIGVLLGGAVAIVVWLAGFIFDTFDAYGHHRALWFGAGVGAFAAAMASDLLVFHLAPIWLPILGLIGFFVLLIVVNIVFENEETQAPTEGPEPEPDLNSVVTDWWS